jgi:citrate lyase subunit beta/citryl-CoA lyase
MTSPMIAEAMAHRPLLDVGRPVHLGERLDAGQRDPELLVDLAAQGVQRRLAGIRLAAGQVEEIGCGALADEQQPARPGDGGGDDEERLHGGEGCQAARRLAVAGSAPMPPSTRPTRPRRSCHSVPGSSERFLAKAPQLEADQVFLDLEDSVAPDEKERARGQVIEALRDLDFGSKTVVFRVNGTDTPYYYRDLIDVVEAVGDKLDAVMLPKVQTPGDVEMTDKLLTQIEIAKGFPVGKIGIEAQIEDAKGLIACETIATASPRMETLIFGPGDYSAAIGIPITTIGGAPEHYPGDHLNYLYSRLVVAARAAGIQAIDGPYAAFKDEDGLRARARLARALGLDGKWTIHPSQIAVVNEIFTPSREEWERAEAMLAAYEDATGTQGLGAAMFEGEMIDEANRKMAERIAKAGRAAGY